MKLKSFCQLTSVPFLLGNMAISVTAFMSCANAQNQPVVTERQPISYPRDINGTIEPYVEPTTTPIQNDDITTQAVASPVPNVATFETTIVRNPFVFSVYDYGAEDGDVVSIIVNGQILSPFVILTSTPQYFEARLNPGVNRIQIVALFEGTSSPTTVALRYDAEQVYDKAVVKHEEDLTIGNSFITTVGYPQIALCQTVVTFPCTNQLYPESAQHVLEALGRPPEPITAPLNPGRVGNPLRNSYPRLLTIDRGPRRGNRFPKVIARRKVSTDPYKCPDPSLQDRDEYPPALFNENNGSAHIKCIGFSDNRGSGNSFGFQINNYKVSNTSTPVQLQDNDVIEFVIQR